MWASGRARAPKTSVGLRTEDRGQPRAGNKEPRVQAPARPTACRAPLRRGPAVTLCVSSLKTSWSQSITRKNRLLGITVPESPRALWVPFLYALEAALPVSSLNVDVPRALRLDLSRLPHGLALAVHNSARGSRTNHTECSPKSVCLAPVSPHIPNRLLDNLLRRPQHLRGSQAPAGRLLRGLAPLPASSAQ